MFQMEKARHAVEVFGLVVERVGKENDALGTKVEVEVVTVKFKEVHKDESHDERPELNNGVLAMSISLTLGARMR